MARVKTLLHLAMLGLVQRQVSYVKELKCPTGFDQKRELLSCFVFARHI